MKTNNNKFQILTFLITLFLSALACQAGANPPTLPEMQVPTALPAVPTFDPNLTNKFEEEWQKSIVEAVTTGSFTVTITEGQFSEFINRKNAENPNSALSNIQIFLRDGQIQLYSTAESDSGSTTLQITATVALSAEGKLQVTVTSAQLGIFPVPESILSSISQSINDALNGQGTTGAENIQLESVVITDGYMTITGTIK
ncbi:MAG: hypothetical protein Fur0022_14290 [Anaerolineales bacterium]